MEPNNEQQSSVGLGAYILEWLIDDGEVAYGMANIIRHRKSRRSPSRIEQDMKTPNGGKAVQPQSASVTPLKDV